MLKDKNGNELKTDFYVGPDAYTHGSGCDIYYVEVSGENSFTAETWDGFLSITNFQEAAGNFTPILQPNVNFNFLRSKLEKLSKK